MLGHVRMGSDAAHSVLCFHSLKREGEIEVQNPSNSLSGLLTNDTVSPPFDFTQGIAGCSQAILALHLPTQSGSYLLPSHTVLPADASAMGRNTPASLWHSGWRAVEKKTQLPPGRISTMDEKRSSRHMKEKLGPGTRQPWKVLNAK